MLHKSRRLKGKILIILQEGVLALAMRMGYWIILDELNLAPSDVLEALNRVLDDNRELFVPETQTLIKAHSSFRIFATQNPSGSSYGGRMISIVESFHRCVDYVKACLIIRV